MATKKDLVEAHAFSRRRLVTAFLSGAPGGREVEPSRPGRTVIGGIALAVLLVAGAAIASVLAARTPDNWKAQGVVQSRQRGTLYAIFTTEDHPTLYPLVGATSAELIFGLDVTPTPIDQSLIDEQPPGEQIGIFGAPATLPEASSFIQTGWTACTRAGAGVAVSVSHSALTRDLPGGGLVVASAGHHWLIARSSDYDADQRAYRYLIPEGPADDEMLHDLGLDNRADAIAVPGAWLRLFPEGGPLGFESFHLNHVGQRVGVPGLTAKARVGQYVVAPDQSGVVLTSAGPSPLDRFALEVYAHSRLPGTHRPPTQVPGTPPAVTQTGRLYLDAHWPTTALQQLHGDPCARLDLSPGAVPRAELTGDPQGAAAVADGSPPTVATPVVDHGHGAFVMSGGWDDTTSGTTFVIDARGSAYPLEGAGTMSTLGYDPSVAPLVPDTWLKLFAPGVTLSTALALCPPQAAPAPNQTCPTLSAS